MSRLISIGGRGLGCGCEGSLAAEERADQERQQADRETNRAAAERERVLHRAQRQARSTVLQLRYLLAPTPANTRLVADLIALLEGYGDLA